MTLQLLFRMTFVFLVFVGCKADVKNAETAKGGEVGTELTAKGAKDVKGMEEDSKALAQKGAKGVDEGNFGDVKAVKVDLPAANEKETREDQEKKVKKEKTEGMQKEEEEIVKNKEDVIVEQKKEVAPEVEEEIKEEKKVVEKTVETQIVPSIEKESVPAPPFNHSLWDELLQKYVSSDGQVNYKGFKSDQARLKKYLVALKENAPDSDWRRAEAMSYWLNAYNAFTIKLIVDNYPVNSIQDIAGGKPWDKEWIELGGKTYSLNYIENKIIRPKYKDARIHFAVNCAARSCPTLYNRAFTPEKLERQLAQLTKTFINNKSFNQISTNKASVSKIFDWYGEDFGSLKAFLNKYSEVKLGDGAKIEFNEYDWGLNE